MKNNDVHATHSINDNNYVLFDPIADPGTDLEAKASENIAATPPIEIHENKTFLYVKPPYFEFEDTKNVMNKLQETYNQKIMLLLIGYSGCGKTTHCVRFANKYPDFVTYYDDFSSFTASGLNVDIGEKFKQPLKQRRSEVFALKNALENCPHAMFIFDDVDAISPGVTLQKMENMRKIWLKTNIPMVFCGTTQLYYDLYKHAGGHFASMLTNLDEHEMSGMHKSDAMKYVDGLKESEHVCFTWDAKNAIVPMALNSRLGGIRSFTKIIGRAITRVRALYYTSPGHSIPDSARCFVPEIKPGQNYPGTKETYTLPITNDILQIDEHLIRYLLADYKIICKKGRIPATGELNE